MEVTIYRYRARDARWDNESVETSDLKILSQRMNTLPFQGEEENRKYGFAQCGVIGKIVYGLFVQKFPKRLIDYDSDTKEERAQVLPDTGQYLFLFYPEKYELYLQTKRSADLPPQDTIIKRFIEVMQQASLNTRFLFTGLDKTRDEVDREKIVRTFYEVADTVTELELEGFDGQLVRDLKDERGGVRQKYFNPREEYQEAMEEATLLLGNDTERMTLKAKKEHSFKKNPIARAGLEAARKPVKIVYTKDNTVHTAYGVNKQKEVLTIEASEFDLDEQIEGLISQISGANRLPKKIKPDGDKQTRLIQ